MSAGTETAATKGFVRAAKGWLVLLSPINRNMNRKNQTRTNGGKSPEQILRSLGITRDAVQRAATEMHAKSVGATPLARRLLANARMY